MRHNQSCGCDICSGKMTFNEMERKQKQFLKNPGWYVDYVPHENGSVDVHTHGLDQFGLFNIQMCLPYPMETAMDIMNAIASRLKDGTWVASEGAELRFEGARFGVITKQVGSRWWRIYIPDTRGIYPWDPKCDKDFVIQMLGPIPVDN